MNKEVNDRCYADFTAFLKTHSGIVLGETKRYLVRSRLSSLMLEFNIDDINDLINKIVSGRDRNITNAAIDAMTTNETLWFRDNYPFDLLKSTIFPMLIEKRGGQAVKIWSAACSSGQEPYSIAMTFKEFCDLQGSGSTSLSITATDLSPTMVSLSKAGIYDELSLSRGGLTPERRQRFFDSLGEGKLSIKSELKRLIDFKQQNLLDNHSAHAKYDVIFCRNVLIYFSAEVKSCILQHFAASLAPNGILFLGASESISTASQYFNLVRCNPGLYYQLKSN